MTIKIEVIVDGSEDGVETLIRCDPTEPTPVELVTVDTLLKLIEFIASPRKGRDDVTDTGENKT